MLTEGHDRCDRRIQRTRGLLQGALASLIHEKPYDGIVVKEILARANVGRSAFYTHFRDKDDLLESSVRELLDETEPVSAPPTSGFADRLLQRTLYLFEHIERHRSAAHGSTDMRRQDVVHERLQGELVRSVGRDLEHVARVRGDGRPSVPNELMAQFVATTFLVVLKWWVESGSPLSAREVNDLFGAMVLSGASGKRPEDWSGLPMGNP